MKTFQPFSPSPLSRWEVDKYKDHYEVRFIDLRYRKERSLSFVAICHIDMDHQIKNSYHKLDFQ